MLLSSLTARDPKLLWQSVAGRDRVSSMLLVSCLNTQPGWLDEALADPHKQHLVMGGGFHVEVAPAQEVFYLRWELNSTDPQKWWPNRQATSSA